MQYKNKSIIELEDMFYRGLWFYCDNDIGYHYASLLLGDQWDGLTYLTPESGM